MVFTANFRQEIHVAELNELKNWKQQNFLIPRQHFEAKMRILSTVSLLAACLILALVEVEHVSSSFDQSAFCARMCALSNGGRLCRCDVAHFVGKRPSGYINPMMTSSSALVDDGKLEGGLTHDDVFDELLVTYWYTSHVTAIT